MHRFSISSISSEDRQRKKKRIWVCTAVTFFVIVLVIACLFIWTPWRRSASACATQLEDVLRFDCHPDRPITKDRCTARGCCYHRASDQDVSDNDLINSRHLGVPSCYFPEKYQGYKWKSIGNGKSGDVIEAVLERVTPSGFSDDVKNVVVSVIPIDDQRLRIQIKDSNSSRHEVKDMVHFQHQKERSRLYKFQIDASQPPSIILKITRKISDAPVFQTDLSRLIFSDQFLQISTNISSQYIYGLGEQKEGILKSTNWTRYTLFNQGDLPVPNRNLYGSHPFFMVMEPCGDSNGIFLLNSHAIDYVLQPTPAVTIRAIGGIFDFFVFLGPSPGSVVSQYSSLFGPPNFPPRWSLGFQLSKYGYFTLENTEKTLQRNIEAGVPLDVQWNDIDYMNRYLDFTYNEKNFTGLPEFVEKLHKNNRHYVAMISPGVSNTEPPQTYSPYDDGKKLDLFIKTMNGSKYIEGKVWNTNTTVFPDFSNPNTSAYWKKHFEKFYKQLKFDGVWLDMNEPLNFFNGSNYGCPDSKYDNPPYVPGRPYPLKTLTLCMSAKHYENLHYSEHNLLAYRENKITHEVMKEMTNKRPFIISRATFAGQGVYSGHWSGDVTSDWKDMRYSIPAMLAFSLYGMPMTGTDICGFRTNTTEELCARWQALGAFYPFSRNHNDYDTIEQDPAIMGSKVLEVTKKALSIRYNFIPYLYTLFYRNHMFGETVARPLFFEFPRDKNTYKIEDEFLWGPAFLVLPALDEKSNSINPYIPEGIWYDLDGVPKFSPGDIFKLQAELTDVNVFVRGGYILPCQKPGMTTVESSKNPFDLFVALDYDQNAEGELYWDDGEALDNIGNGMYNLIQFKASQDYLKVNTFNRGYDIPMPLGNITIHGLPYEPIGITINDAGVPTVIISSRDPSGNTRHSLIIIGTGYDLLKELTVRWGFKR